MQKAVEEAQRGALVVALVPARTDTRWWHSAAPHASVRFLKGRLKFGSAKTSAPFPSALMIFHPRASSSDRIDPCPVASPSIESSQRQSTQLYGGTHVQGRGRKSLVPILSAEVLPPVGIMTLSELADRTCEYLAARGRSANTVLAYSVVFRQFIAHVIGLGRKDSVLAFTEASVESFVVALHKGGVGPNTIRTRLSALATLAKIGGKLRDRNGRPILKINPVVGVERPKRKRPQREILGTNRIESLHGSPTRGTYQRRA
jgi:site-specific DNA-methyltransferase (adenine-specific)